MARKASSAAARKPADTARNVSARVELSAEVLPRRTLKDAEAVAQVLNREYAAGSASWDDIARVLEIGPKSPNTKYLMWAAQAYGLITKDESGYSLSETGRKIVAPTYDREDAEARVKALLTPSLSSKFYTDYNGHSIPSAQHFGNVLENRYQVPRDRTEEVKTLLVENAKHAGILVGPPDGNQQISLSGLGITTPVPAAVPDDVAAPAPGPAAEGDWNSTVFIITPIGDEGSEVRKHADMVLKHLLDPVLGGEDLKLRVVRADKIEKSGLITKQIFEHLAHARLCVADLSFSNANAFYELGVRHVMKRPTIQIIRKGDRIPFDVSQGRTIIVDTSDIYTIMDRFESARRELKEHVRHALSTDTGGVAEDNPVQTYLPALKVTVGSEA